MSRAIFVLLVLVFYSSIDEGRTFTTLHMRSSSNSDLNLNSNICVDRAKFIAYAATSSIIAVPLISAADSELETANIPRSSTRLGGILEPYSDISRGFRISKPLGWNKFDAVPGEYDVKFTDLVNRSEIITLKNTPVKSDTTLESLGDPETVGKKLATGRNLELTNNRKRITEGIIFYDFEMSGTRIHQIYTLCIYRGKLWSLEAITSQKDWKRREEAYKTIQESFVPKL